jgi:transposase InsO family protein
MPWKKVEPVNQRKEFVLRAIETSNFRELCQEYGISPKTGYKWRERFLEHGLAGMNELSRRPQSHPDELKESVVCDIVRLRQLHPTWGARKLRKVYERNHAQVPSESSFKRVMERAGLVEPRRLRSRQESGRLFTERRAQAPNEVWTVDFKGWWRVADGSRCEPLTVRDELSRYVLEVRAVADARTATVRSCFERLFQENGLPEAMRSDNGPPFASTCSVLGMSKLSAWWVALGIDLERGRKGCPQDNGAHERLHLDIQRELRSRQGLDPQAGFDEWRRTFNHERPHEALGMKCPAEVYEKSPRRYQGSPEDLTYDLPETRRVNQVGEIGWQHQRVFISTALAGWSVGLQPAKADLWEVWFGRLLLGHVDERGTAFRRIDTPPVP